jgi:IS5 family transposase
MDFHGRDSIFKRAFVSLSSTILSGKQPKTRRISILMRMKASRQLPLDFAGTQNLTKEWYALYRSIDEILQANPKVLELVHADLTEGQPKLKRNVEGIASESILRLAIVQQIEGLSFRGLIITVDDSQMLRFFCRFYDDPMISHSKYATLVNRIRPTTWEQINEIIVRFARDKKKFKGRKLRIDTTAVETDIHYPTDSSLLADCVNVLSRLIRKVREIAPAVVGTGRTRVRHANKLAQKIARGGKALHKASGKRLYGNLIAATERVMTWADEIRKGIEQGNRGGLDGLELQALGQDIGQYLPRAKQCVHQARERVLNERPVPNDEKLFSIFEPHTELLLRGKASKPVEFGHMVEFHQVEGGLISQYAVHLKRPVEPPLLQDGLIEHQKTFGRLPKTCATDKGFYSAEAVAKAQALGVKHVCVPKKGRRNAAEERRERSGWFKLGQAFRAGIEGAISVLKRVFGLRRCLREGWTHFQSWVGSGVLAHNLVLLART